MCNPHPVVSLWVPTCVVSQRGAQYREDLAKLGEILAEEEKTNYLLTDRSVGVTHVPRALLFLTAQDTPLTPHHDPHVGLSPPSVKQQSVVHPHMALGYPLKPGVYMEWLFDGKELRDGMQGTSHPPPPSLSAPRVVCAQS